jgi:hypothetical protein
MTSSQAISQWCRRHPAWSSVLAGELASAASAFVLFQSLHPISQSRSQRLLLACITVSGSTLAGVLVALLLARLSKQGLRTIAPVLLQGGICWAMLAPTIFALDRHHPWLIVLPGIAAACLAICLQKLSPAESSSDPHPVSPLASPPHFADLPHSNAGFLYALVIALGLVIAAAALLNEHPRSAASALAVCCFLFLWRLSSDPTESQRRTNENTADQTRRLAVALLLAILLIDTASTSTARHIGAGSPRTRIRRPLPPHFAPIASAEYLGIVLLDTPEKKPPTPPPAPASKGPHGIHARDPLVIPFSGAYWYFQPPERSPGTLAHIAHGSPMEKIIRSKDWRSLRMEADQPLAQPIDLTCCSQLKLTVSNKDRNAGEIWLGVILVDSKSPGHPTQALEPQRVPSSVQATQTAAIAPPSEDLTFAIPPNATLHTFDEITVLYLPDGDHRKQGTRLAIRSFTLLPR